LIPVSETPSATVIDPQSEIFRQIDASSDRFVEQLRAVCRQPSVSAQNLGLDETSELVGRLLKDIGFTVEQFSPSKGPPVIFAELPSKTGRRTVSYTHLTLPTICSV